MTKPYFDVRVSEEEPGLWKAGVHDECGTYEGAGGTPRLALEDLAGTWLDAEFKELARVNKIRDDDHLAAQAEDEAACGH